MPIVKTKSAAGIGLRAGLVRPCTDQFSGYIGCFFSLSPFLWLLIQQQFVAPLIDHGQQIAVYGDGELFLIAVIIGQRENVTVDSIGKGILRTADHNTGAVSIENEGVVPVAVTLQ